MHPQRANFWRIVTKNGLISYGKRGDYALVGMLRHCALRNIPALLVWVNTEFESRRPHKLHRFFFEELS